MVMMKEIHVEDCKILGNEQISPGIYEIIIESASMTASTKPGQFVNIKAGKGLDPLLRRPISINKINNEEKTITLVYQVVGRGTEAISQLEPGDVLDVMGPLGNPFPIHKGKRCAVIGGGIGTAPLLELASKLEACDAYLGFRSEPYKLKEFGKCCSKVEVATEDGSYGHKGFVTELLARELNSYEVVYTCGPKMMMKIVKEMCLAAGVKCYVSVEERMGCGVGACLVCACKTVNENGEAHYKKACVDGPVFEAWEVDFNE